MSATTSDIHFRASATVTDTAATNGGLPSTTNLVSGVKGTVLPIVLPAEVTAGLTRWRKIFVSCNDSGNLGIAGSYYFLDTLISGTDDVQFCDPIAVGSTWDDHQADLVSAGVAEADMYGQGHLHASLTAGVSTQVQVHVKDGHKPGFTLTAGGKLYCFIDDGSNEEFFSVDTISVNTGTDIVTLTIADAGTIANAYTAAVTVIVAACCEVTAPGCAAGVLLANVGVVTTSTSAGTFDDGEVTVENDGCRKDTYTLTFEAGGATFTAAGAAYGALTDGAIASDYSPVDSDGKVLFTVDSAAWGGTWAAGETVTIPTNPAQVPLWHRHLVLAGSAAVSNDLTWGALEFSPV